jgi:hypothetical protein
MPRKNIYAPIAEGRKLGREIFLRVHDPQKTWGTKIKAKQEAAEWRKRGRKVRVIPCKDGYAVYIGKRRR